MSCPIASYEPEPSIRVRSVPELGVCYVYTPARPALHRLNAASWLILSLCDGRTFAALASEFHAAAAVAETSDAALRAGLAELLALGIVRETNTISDDGSEGE